MSAPSLDPVQKLVNWITACVAHEEPVHSAAATMLIAAVLSKGLGETREQFAHRAMLAHDSVEVEVTLPDENRDSTTCKE